MVEAPVRIGTFNVKFGEMASPEEVAEFLEPYKLDIIGFSEVPAGDWTSRVGTALGLDHAFVGEISSANHKDKYKSILSRNPLNDMGETELTSGTGWKPASAVFGSTEIQGVEVTFYELHIAASTGDTGQAHELVESEFTSRDGGNIVVAGDFNNEIGDSSLSSFDDAGFISVWAGAGINPHRLSSVTGYSRIGVIDHIFVRSQESAKVTAAAVLDMPRPLSDHKPVVAEIQFRECQAIGRA